jgi:methyl coenzyme M reductase gamma subunit
MNAPLIAPLIPPRGRSGSREHGRAAPTRRPPVAAMPEVPAVPDDVVYGFGRMDESGRVADRTMTDGMVTMPAKPYIVIPAALRRRCGLRPGDRVLLAVFLARDTLAAYSFAVVDQALRAHAAVRVEGRLS